jgi:hypothetical protein
MTTGASTASGSAARPVGSPLPPASEEDGADQVPTSDPFFEKLLDATASPVMVRGVAFDASAIAQLDNDAYRTLRADLLDEVSARIHDRLDGESLDRLMRFPSLIPKGRVVPFIGAGLSAELGLPTWASFLARLADGRVEPATAKTALENGELEALATLIIESAGPDLFDERLSVYDAFSALSPVHQLLPMLFRHSVYTTNFDRAVENAYEQEGLPFSIVVRGSESWHGLAAAESLGERALVKLHGDSRIAGTRILSAEEYDIAYVPDSPLFRDLKYLLGAFVVLFMGCSLNSDRPMDIALLVARSLGREGPRHYAFLPIPDTREMKADRERFLTARHIFPIWYPADDGDHSLLGEMLWYIAQTLPEGG